MPPDSLISVLPRPWHHRFSGYATGNVRTGKHLFEVFEPTEIKSEVCAENLKQTLSPTVPENEVNKEFIT